MRSFHGPRRRLSATALGSALLLGGCAGTAIDENFGAVRQLTESGLGGELKWLNSEEARRDAELRVDALLGEPLHADDAVRIALAHSPALQAALFEGAADSAAATRSARLPSPIFTFERLVRREGGSVDLDIGRALSVSVFDLLLLPSRLRLADHRQEQIRLRLAGEVVQAATEARQGWVRAVSAQQSLQYAEQVKASADASAELARRMQAVGNFSKLQRAREQAFAADAVTRLAHAAQARQSAREALVRSLGLTEAQARRLRLPERLPDLPKAPRSEADVARQAIDQRLDIRLARANLEFTARDLGLSRRTSFLDGFEVAGVRNSATGKPPQKGFELEIPLPIFDVGEALRARSEATYLAAVQRTAQLAVEASSQVRENYGAYRTAYDVARHHLEEVVPLRRTIAEENQLRYNGMLISVFELLAEAREQIRSVDQVIQAQRDFWLADAALQSALLGRPAAGPAVQAEPTIRTGGAGGH